MAGVPFHCIEGRVQCCATHGVIDDVEPFALGMRDDVFFDRHRAIVNRNGAKLFDNALLLRRDGGKNLRSECTRNLNCDMADPAGTCVDEYLLIRAHVCSVNKALPGRNGAEG